MRDCPAADALGASRAPTEFGAAARMRADAADALGIPGEAVVPGAPGPQARPLPCQARPGGTVVPGAPGSGPGSLLELRGLSLAYDGVPVVHDVSLSVAPGQVVGLVGESGSGKSTLLKAAMGMFDEGMSLCGGQALFQGGDLAAMGPSQLRELRGPQIAAVFQDSAASFCPVRRIGVQVLEAVRAHGRMTRAACEGLFCDTLARLGMAEPERVWRAYPHELSGGMAQRVGIACALMLHPRLLLADEPTSALDVAAQAQVVAALRQARDEFGCAILLVTHNFGLVEELCDEAAVLRAGRVVERGLVEHLLREPRDPYTRELLAAVPRMRKE